MSGRGRGGFDCDVLVVGGGIVGLSTAYAITRAAPGHPGGGAGEGVRPGAPSDAAATAE